MGLDCWRQLMIRSNIATGGTPSTKRLISMGLEGGLGIGLLASTFDVESVVFLRLGSHFLCGGVEDSNAKIFENRIGS